MKQKAAQKRAGAFTNIIHGISLLLPERYRLAPSNASNAARVVLAGRSPCVNFRLIGAARRRPFLPRCRQNRFSTSPPAAEYPDFKASGLAYCCSGSSRLSQAPAVCSTVSVFLQTKANISCYRGESELSTWRKTFLSPRDSVSAKARRRKWLPCRGISSR